MTRGPELLQKGRLVWLRADLCGGLFPRRCVTNVWREVLPSVEEWRHDLYTRLAKVDGRPVEELYERAEEIVTQVERSQASFERRQRAKYEAQFGPPPAGWSPGMIRERTLSYPLLQTDQTVGFEFEQWAEMARSAFREVDIDLDDLEVRSRDERQYPLASIEVELADSSFPTSLRRFGGRYLVEGCASDLLGSLGPVGAEHIEQHPFGLQNEDALGGYRVGDEVGIRGIEAAQESNCVAHWVRSTLCRWKFGNQDH